MARFDRKDVVPVILAAIIVGFLLFASYKLIIDEPVFAATPPFDHSDCQYPSRLTNPPNGCDNSDSACGVLKDGTEPCPEPKDDTQPILETETPPAASPAPEISNCKE